MIAAERRLSRVNRLAVHVAAFVVAGFIPAFVLSWPTIPLLLPAFVITLAYSALVAAPVFLILREQSERWINAISSTVSGFAIGAVSGLLLAPMFPYGNCRLDGVRMVVDGTLTQAAWLSLVQFSVGIGAAGALGGLGFWLTLKVAGALPSQHQVGNRCRSGMGRTLASGALVALTLLLAAGAFGRSSIDQLFGYRPYCGAMIP